MSALKPYTYVIARNVKACLLVPSKRKDSVQFFLTQAQYVDDETDTTKVLYFRWIAAVVTSSKRTDPSEWHFIKSRIFITCRTMTLFHTSRI